MFENVFAQTGKTAGIFLECHKNLFTNITVWNIFQNFLEEHVYGIFFVNACIFVHWHFYVYNFLLKSGKPFCKVLLCFLGFLMQKKWNYKKNYHRKWQTMITIFFLLFDHIFQKQCTSM